MSHATTGRGFGLLPAPAGVQARARAAAWVAVAAALAIVLVYGDTASGMLALWRRSETFSHGFVVVPIALWLIWRRRNELARLPVRPYWPALAAVAGAGFVWLLGRLAGADVVQQFGLVSMVIAAMPAILGASMARAMSFPLAFLLFTVPFGEAFVPVLIDWTADFTVAALKLTGVPVYREGNHFVIPTGQWSVVEACSGLRYLIASLMAGTLYAYLMYASVWRRAAFIAASLAVPLVANWLRAYLIVMLGHLSGNELAVGVDHLIYGWLFFGFVIALMFWAGARFRENVAAAVIAHAPLAGPAAGRTTLIGAALTVVALAGVWPALAAALTHERSTPAQPLAAIEGRAGWTAVAAAELPWWPRFSGQRASLQQAFERDGRRVWMFVAYYTAQKGGHEMVNAANVLVAADDPVWRATSQSGAVLSSGTGDIRAATARIVGRDSAFDVVWWYWIDGATTASDGAAKALQAWSRLMLRPDTAAAVFVFTEAAGRADASDVLRGFVADMAESIERALLAARVAQKR